MGRREGVLARLIHDREEGQAEVGSLSYSQMKVREVGRVEACTLARAGMASCLTMMEEVREAVGMMEAVHLDFAAAF